MLLKRQEKDNLIKAMYDSSNVIASIYNTQTNDLDIIFKAGTKYRYTNVSKPDYMRLEIAESQGVVFNTHIKKYPAHKIEERIDMSKILSESDDLKAKEDTAFLEGKRKTLVTALKDAIEINEKMELRSINAKSPENMAEFDKRIVNLKVQIDNYLSQLK